MNQPTNPDTGEPTSLAGTFAVLADSCDDTDEGCGRQHGYRHGAILAKPYDDLLAAARTALPRLERTVAHNGTCRYRIAMNYGANDPRETAGKEANLCTCGLWQTREALRAAIEKASGDE